MNFVTFQIGDEPPRPGMINHHSIADFGDLGYPDLLAYIRAGHPYGMRNPPIRTNPDGYQLGGKVRLLAPIPNPPRIFGIGLNYRDHAAESKMQLPSAPTVFLKLASSVIGCYEPVRIPSLTRQPDYEVELAVVIGKPGRNIPKENWRDHVFGYTILNDVSARDIQFSTSQWTLAKSFDTFCPIGPAIVTADRIPDPHALDIQLRIGSEVLQHSNTRELIFQIPDLIAYISSITALQTGDIISTGTPAGVGFARHPQRWLQPGDKMTAEIEHIGQLINPVVAGE